MTELDVLLAPPGPRGGNPAGMRDGRPDATLVVTHTPSRVGLGNKLEIPADGIVLGGSGSDIEIEGAQASGSRLEIRWLGAATDGSDEWRADAAGRVAFNREMATHRTLRSGDDVRVVDTFFRFLCGSELQEQYYETIYHLTIRDMSTGLANTRYLREAMNREVLRALRHATRLALVTLQFQAPVDSGSVATTDLLNEVSDGIRDGLPRTWVAARVDNLEVVVLAPETSQKELEQRARGWLRRCSLPTPPTRLGTAELGGSVQDAAALLETARNNATNQPG